MQFDIAFYFLNMTNWIFQEFRKHKISEFLEFFYVKLFRIFPDPENIKTLLKTLKKQT